MIRKELKNEFQIRISGSENWVPFTIPGSAMDTFVRAGVLPDPYFGTNEYPVKEFLDQDFEIRGSFYLDKEERLPHMFLKFYGVDTLSEIQLNGRLLGCTENMHRIWRFPVENILKDGENTLEIRLFSAQRYIREHKPTKGREIHMVSVGSMPGEQYLRKAHCMFGWDWGPQLPDAGIFRKIELFGYTSACLGETLIRQKHGSGRVTLSMETEYSLGKNLIKTWLPDCNDIDSKTGMMLPDGSYMLENSDAGVKIIYQVLDPDGTLLYEGEKPETVIEHPRLWWPNGLGEHPLYTVKVRLMAGESDVEEKSYRIGLRTLTVSREEDTWGEEFAFQINGKKIFARGANYIPDDCYYSRITEEIEERDIRAAVFANYNCLRIWGGGYYPSDHFYDLCDESGILLWQDLMYACNIYDVTPEFAENIKAETRDNLLRFRNHACLALICGNNELETAWAYWGDTKGHAPSLKRDYLYQFEYLLAEVVRNTAPDTFYWPSSPSSGGSFDEPGDENRGDSHYWDVWHGQLPFSDYLKHYFRFCSEFGFESLPSMKTIESFTEEEDRNLFSRVMESHQKNPAANGKILYYLSESCRYPKDLESLVYVSQILQGYAMKVATDHWRRNRGRCMGSLYWQFNDNWPVASWSSMDYYGRYKALHYMAREFFAPVAGSIEKGERFASFRISNETLQPVFVQAEIALKTLDFEVIFEEQAQKEINSLSAESLWKKDLRELIHGREDRVFLTVCYTWEENGEKMERTDFETFVPMKYLKLPDPKLHVKVLENGDVTLAAEAFAPYCMAEGMDADAVWDKNAVTLTDRHPVTLHLLSGSKKAREVRVYDVYHTYH